MNEQITPSLEANREQLCKLFGLPDNIGIMLHELPVGGDPPGRALLLWVDGLSSDPLRNLHVLEPLSSYRGPAAQGPVSRALSTPQRTTGSLKEVAEAVLSGATALLADGWTEALVLDTAPTDSPTGNEPRHPVPDRLTRSLRTNVAQMRLRLRDPKLMARPVLSKASTSGKAALVWLDGKADPDVVRRVKQWAEGRVKEEKASLGIMAGYRALFGLVPRFFMTPRADNAAVLLDSGYVLLMIDRVAHAYAAPVTVAAWFTSPNDFDFPYPTRHLLQRVRVALHLYVLLHPAAVVSLLNYHHELIPTSFLLGIAAVRENAPFGVIFEVAWLELVFALCRFAAFQLPGKINPGSALVVGVLIALLFVLTGLTGPITTVSAAVAAVATLALPTYEGAYIVRAWRVLILLGAIMIGFFGTAALFVFMVAYLCQARSWGVPVLGETGIALNARQVVSSRRPGRSVRRPLKGGGL